MEVLEHSEEHSLIDFSANLVAQMVKRLPVMRENWVRPLGWEDPLDRGAAKHSSILAWENQWTKETDGLAKSRTRLIDFHFI